MKTFKLKSRLGMAARRWCSIFQIIGPVLLCLPQSSAAQQAAWDDSFKVHLTRQGNVDSVGVRSNGLILIRGSFSYVGTVYRNGIAQINTNGALDPAFNPGRFLSGTPLAFSLLPDGRLLVGDRMSSGSILIRCFAEDGTLDLTFDNTPGFERLNYAGPVEQLELLPLPDGRILVGGLFHRFNGSNCVSLARLLPNGRLDETFSVGTALDQFTGVLGLALDRGGYLAKIVRSGSPAEFVRVSANGTIDRSRPFSTEERQRVELAVLDDGRRVSMSGNVLTLYATNGTRQLAWTSSRFNPPLNIRHCAVLRNHAFLVPGTGVDATNGRANFGLVRMKSSGPFDRTFVMPGGVAVPSTIDQVVCLRDGTMFVGGNFNLANGIRCSSVIRLEPDGKLDRRFALSAGFDGRLAVTHEGMILAGFASLNRFFTNGVRDSSFSTLLFCEGIQEVIVDGTNAIFLVTRPDGPCWLNNSSPRLHRANYADGHLDFRFESSLPGLWGFGQVVPSVADSSVWLIGVAFPGVWPTSYPRIIRVRADGSQDTNFAFQGSEFYGLGALGAQAETNGNLVVLTTELDSGWVLEIRPDGSLARTNVVLTRLPQFALATLRASDRSWLVANNDHLSPTTTMQRIGNDGRLLASAKVPFLSGQGASVVAFDNQERVLIAGPALVRPDGPWSGLLRLRADALSPVTMHLTRKSAAVKIDLRGPAERHVRIQFSSDLANWSDWIGLYLTSGEQTIEVPLPTDAGNWFYRIIAVED